jgi:hypothetical protein
MNLYNDNLIDGSGNVLDATTKKGFCIKINPNNKYEIYNKFSKSTDTDNDDKVTVTVDDADLIDSDSTTTNFENLIAHLISSAKKLYNAGLDDEENLGIVEYFILSSQNGGTTSTECVMEVPTSITINPKDVDGVTLTPFGLFIRWQQPDPVSESDSDSSPTSYNYTISDPLRYGDDAGEILLYTREGSTGTTVYYQREYDQYYSEVYTEHTGTVYEVVDNSTYEQSSDASFNAINPVDAYEEYSINYNGTSWELKGQNDSGQFTVDISNISYNATFVDSNGIPIYGYLSSDGSGRNLSPSFVDNVLTWVDSEDPALGPGNTVPTTYTTGVYIRMTDISYNAV